MITTTTPCLRVLTIWRILLVLLAILPALAISFFLKGWIYVIATFLWFILFIGSYLFYLPALYKSIVYSLDNHTLMVQRGVFYKNLYTIPISRIQFTTIIISPISKLFGLVTLQVIAPGGRISLPGLTAKEAQLFTNEIAKAKENSNDSTFS